MAVCVLVLHNNDNKPTIYKYDARTNDVNLLIRHAVNKLWRFAPTKVSQL